MGGIPFLYLTSTIMAAITPAASLTTRQISATGPYAPKTTTSTLLPSHTIYQPSDLSAVPDSLPVVIWGNDACNSTSAKDPYKALNEELASWGAMVFACGPPTPVLALLESDAGKEAWENVDADKIAENPLVLSLAVLDVKHALSTEETRAVVANATKPVFWFSAESAGLVTLDQGKMGVRADFDAVAKGVPAWYGALPGVDGEVLGEGAAGKMGRAGRFWTQWMVGGNQTASEFFVDAAGAESEGWTVVRKGLDVLVL
ncbi:hypothetical protein EKO04_002665 [Ascochyta lentis]|uniref:Uncharacterized protein n=1 Tax=Ascochyta lentis TaxID=205686 RepID=A0A8H7J7J2_9PLEO|nr:hypothetical protein EKO04_002665 [Ascochyta lentis]